MRFHQGVAGVLVMLVLPSLGLAAWPCGSLETPLRTGDIFYNRQPEVSPNALVARTLFTLNWCPTEVYWVFYDDSRTTKRWLQYLQDYGRALKGRPQAAEVGQFIEELSGLLASQPAEAKYEQTRQMLIQALRESPLMQLSGRADARQGGSGKAATQLPCGVIARRVIEEAIESWKSSPYGPADPGFSTDLLFPLGACPDEFYEAMARRPAELSSWLKVLPAASFTGDPVKEYEASRLALVSVLRQHSPPEKYREIHAAILNRLQEFEAKPIVDWGPSDEEFVEEMKRRHAERETRK